VTSLQSLYRQLKPQIEARLETFSALWQRGSSDDIFREMCFCTCTPQNDAKKAWGAVTLLSKKYAFAELAQPDAAAVLHDNGVRFHNNKAQYIIQNRDTFYPRTKSILKKMLDTGTVPAVRDTLAKQVTGWGLKEASHFLRNIGYGSEICILDRHILRCLVSYGVVGSIPKPLSGGTYHNIEQTMLAFARAEKIPADALDLLFWYEEKNELFK
jgi:N-glycosylase/DNA lyase